MVLSYKVRQFVLEKESYSLLDLNLNTKKRIGTHDFLALWVLCQYAGKVVTKEDLFDKAWPGKIVAESSITQAISNIRNIIGDNGKEQKWLKTISKVGYSLDETIVVAIERSSESVNTGQVTPSVPLRLDMQRQNVPSISRIKVLTSWLKYFPVMKRLKGGVLSLIILSWGLVAVHTLQHSPHHPELIFKTNNLRTAPKGGRRGLIPPSENFFQSLY